MEIENASPADAVTAPRGRHRRRSRRRRSLVFDLTALAVVGALLVASLGAGAIVVYRELYSPSAFVERYLAMLGEGRAADALAVPGVEVGAADLRRAGLPESASDVLLRKAALVGLDDVEVTDESVQGDVTEVTVVYAAGGHRGTTTFEVERDGWIGVAPAWRFATSPLAAIELTVRGAREFAVNGFEIDTRQISPDGVDAAPEDPVSMLVFSPGMYSIDVDTAIAETPGVAVLSDVPATGIPVVLQTQPTDEFIDVVQKQVDDFLASCATQKVLQPTGCPFGYFIRNRVEGEPAWSMSENPVVSVVPDGAMWAIPRTAAKAHIDVEVRSIFDGRLYDVSEDVEFFLTGTITILPDGKASIQVSAAQ